MSDEPEVLKQSGYGLTDIQFRNLPGGTEMKAKNLNQDSRRFSQDSNRESPHYKSRILPLFGVS
jgi:hypothetical protein